jgi:hypothetical protein
MTMGKDALERKGIDASCHSPADRSKTDRMTENVSKPLSEESIAISQLESRLRILEEGAATWLGRR